MSVITKMENKFSSESLDSLDKRRESIDQVLEMMKGYVQIEHSVAVISDLAKKRVIFYREIFETFLRWILLNILLLIQFGKTIFTSGFTLTISLTDIF